MNSEKAGRTTGFASGLIRESASIPLDRIGKVRARLYFPCGKEEPMKPKHGESPISVCQHIKSEVKIISGKGSCFRITLFYFYLFVTKYGMHKPVIMGENEEVHYLLH